MEYPLPDLFSFMILKNFWPVIIWSIIILVLTGVPGNVIPKVGNFWDWMSPDKLAHFFLYGVFIYLLLKNTLKQSSASALNKKQILLLLIVGIVFAAITEILQAKVFINRNGNWYDFGANVIGCLAGLAIYSLKTKKKRINL
jgi:hypothetical protein